MLHQDQLTSFWPKPDLDRSCNSAPSVALCSPNPSTRKLSNHSISRAKIFSNVTTTSASDLLNQESFPSNQNIQVITQTTSAQRSPYLLSDVSPLPAIKNGGLLSLSTPNSSNESQVKFCLSQHASSLFHQDNSDKSETPQLIANFIPVAKTLSTFPSSQLQQFFQLPENLTQNSGSPFSISNLSINEGLLEYILKSQQQQQQQDQQQQHQNLSHLVPSNNLLRNTTNLNSNNEVSYLEALKNELIQQQVLQLQQQQQQLLSSSTSSVNMTNINLESNATTASAFSANQLQNFVQTLNETFTQSQPKLQIENNTAAPNSQTSAVLANFNDAIIPGIKNIIMFF